MGFSTLSPTIGTAYYKALNPALPQASQSDYTSTSVTDDFSMQLRTPNIVIVCLLALATLWMSEFAAAHVHLDSDNVSCEICHSSHNNNAALQSHPLAFLAIHLVATKHVATATPLVSHSAAPENSRAPPSLN
ncbi:MAG: hypothetical protein EP334_01260 [Gammaproteobacteria bacterium]|nr:MAG: hypothetical protein EP334_01260 [Gammaproteobacteria bacterium]